MKDKTDEKSYFNKVNTSDQTDIFTFLINSQEVIDVFDHQNTTIQYQMVDIKSTDLVLEAKTNSIDLHPPEIPLVMAFISRRERYMAEAKKFVVDVNNKKLVIKRDELKIFRVQRRHHFRVTVPENRPLHAMVQLESAKQVAGLLKIIDISAGGFLLHVPLALAEQGWQAPARVQATINLTDKSKIAVQGEIRYAKTVGDAKQVGVQFSNLSADLQKDLFSLVMSIHRQVFTKI